MSWLFTYPQGHPRCIYFLSSAQEKWRFLRKIFQDFSPAYASEQGITFDCPKFTTFPLWQNPANCLQVWRRCGLKVERSLLYISMCVSLLFKMARSCAYPWSLTIGQYFPMCKRHARGHELNSLLDAHCRAGIRWTFLNLYIEEKKSENDCLFC